MTVMGSATAASPWPCMQVLTTAPHSQGHTPKAPPPRGPCMQVLTTAPPPPHVPSMGPGARGSGRHMGWRWRCGEHLHAGPWGGGGGRAHHSQSREPLGAIPRLTLVGCPTSLSFLTTVTVASSSSNTPVAEIRNDWRAVDWGTRNGRCAVISGHYGVIMGSSWGHHGVIMGSSEIIRVHISVLTWYASRPVFGGSRARRRRPCSACARECT